MRIPIFNSLGKIQPEGPLPLGHSLSPSISLLFFACFLPFATMSSDRSGQNNPLTYLSNQVSEKVNELVQCMANDGVHLSEHNQNVPFQLPEFKLQNAEA